MRIVRYRYIRGAVEHSITLLLTGDKTGFEVWPVEDKNHAWVMDDVLTTIIHPIVSEQFVATVVFVAEVLE